MIIDKDTCKTLLQITTSDNDSLIELNIPIIEEAICKYCNTDFLQTNLTPVIDSNITFQNSDNSINLSGIDEYKFYANDSIIVYNSVRNDGRYTIDSITSSKLVLNSINNVTDEDENQLVYIAKIQYPRDIMFIAAKMIEYNLQKLVPGYIKKTVDDHSWELDANMVNGFPKTIMAGLVQHRRLYYKGIDSLLKGWL